MVCMTVPKVVVPWLNPSFLAGSSRRRIVEKACMAGRRKFSVGDYALKVRRSRTGCGLFTVESIEKGRCVAEYTGRILPEEEWYSSRSKYLFEVSKRKTIDGSERDNIARYINHSCRPNCEIEIWRGRVFVMARRAIKSGEELSYDYGSEYFKHHIQPKGCKCSKCLPIEK
jgi:SET domain-containing protein